MSTPAISAIPNKMMMIMMMINLELKVLTPTIKNKTSLSLTYGEPFAVF